jgi:hypothetical protein
MALSAIAKILHSIFGYVLITDRWSELRRSGSVLAMAGYSAGGAGFGRADDGRGAERNGVRLRKVFAGIEIVELGYGGAGREGGAEFKEAGFEVGDVLTKVDGASIIGEETSCAEALRIIAEGQGGVGQAFVEGFRRVPAFPRPTRSAISGRVARRAFSHSPQGAAVNEVDALARNMNNTLVGASTNGANGHAAPIIGRQNAQAVAAGPEVDAVLKEVMEKANRYSREMGGGRGSGGLDRSPMTASGPGVSHQSWGGGGEEGVGVPSVSSPFNDSYGSDDVAEGASWAPLRIHDDNVALLGVGGLVIDSARNSNSTSNAVRKMHEEDRTALVDSDFLVEAVEAILDQICFADKFLSSEDSVVDLKPFLRPLPEINKAHLGHVTFRALRDLVIRLATFKDEKTRDVRNLSQAREELEQAYQLVDDQKRLIEDLEAQVNDLQAVIKKKEEQLGAKNDTILTQEAALDLAKKREEQHTIVHHIDRKNQEHDMANLKADLNQKLHKKDSETLELVSQHRELLEKVSREYAEKCEALEASVVIREKSVRREMEAFERERVEMAEQKKHELGVMQNRQERQMIALAEKHEETLIKERRLFEAAKIQLRHQRDVLHRKLGETLDAEQDAKEREGQVLQMNADTQTTVAELQNIIVALRELEQQNQLTIQAQQQELLKVHEHLTESTQQLLIAERREKAQRQHFELVGNDNHATIKSLTDDLRFLIKKREEDYVNLLNQNQANEDAWRRNASMLSKQLQTMRSDVVLQITAINKRLGKSRVTAQFLKPAKPGSSRTPGVHVQRPSIITGQGGGLGEFDRVEGVTKEDLEGLRTDLEEQVTVASALQTLMTHNKQLQIEVEEWQTKATNAKKMAQQVALALQGQANRKSANIGQERASELKRQLKNLNPDLKLLDGVAAYKEAART